MRITASIATVVAVLLGAVGALAGPAAATAAVAAASDDSSKVTWAVRPADADGADGRSWVEHELDPGERIEEHLVVTNYSKTPVTFRLSAADGYFTETGRFNMLPSDRASTDAGTWIEVAESVSLDPGESEILPFVIAVPDDATPGDHPAGIAASLLSDGSGTVGVESRVGFRVMTRVTGELAPSLDTQMNAEYHGSVNPFEPGVVSIQYRITNTGNTRLRVDSDASVAGPLGLFTTAAAVDPIEEIAPGETRVLDSTVRGVWPLFAIFVSGQSQAHAVTEGLEVGAIAPVSSSTPVLAIPWSQLVVLALAAALVWWWRWDRRRGVRETRRLIDEARAQGRAEADDTAVPRTVGSQRSAHG